MTIFALSSGSGRAGVAVFRISGPGAGPALRRLSGGELPVARKATLVGLRDPESGVPLDRALALWFPGPRSFTGEDVVELHVHGGRAVVAGVVETLSKQSGLRPADPGEFARRAFENGRLDLTEVEGLADLINAETEAQRRQALRQMEGALGRVYDGWRARLVGALARLEAAIDFPEEELPDGLVRQVNTEIRDVRDDVAQHLDAGGRGEQIRDGFRVVILGAPNVGKSSLLNHLAQRDVAIVSDTEGTTRDVIEVHLDLGGYPVSVSDTAGLRGAAGAVEAEGVRRALGRAADSDYRIILFDAAAWPDRNPESERLVDGDSLVVVNKIDRVGERSAFTWPGLEVWPISVKTGQGLEEVLSRLRGEIVSRLDVTGPPAMTRVRHRLALEECAERLSQAQIAKAAELVAEDLRMAVRALGRITGRVDVEDLLDVVFSEFCIGK